MPIYAITKAAPDMNRSAYQRRLENSAPAVRDKCRRLEQQLGRMGRMSEVLENAASLIAAERGTAAMLITFDHSTLDIEVASFEGELGANQFQSSTPPTLMAMALAERCSVQVPDISGLDQKSMIQRFRESKGREIFGKSLKRVDFVSEEGIKAEEHFHSMISDVLPMDFTWERGAVLFTPLGSERSMLLGLGLIYEYREAGPFTLPEIMEARTISSLFSLKIAEAFLAEVAVDR